MGHEIYRVTAVDQVGDFALGLEFADGTRR